MAELLPLRDSRPGRPGTSRPRLGAECPPILSDGEEKAVRSLDELDAVGKLHFFAYVEWRYAFALPIQGRSDLDRPWLDRGRAFGRLQRKLLTLLDATDGTHTAADLITALWPGASAPEKTLRGRLRQLQRSVNRRLALSRPQWQIRRPARGLLELTVISTAARLVRRSAA
jgi:hypothetical protein